MSIYIRGGFENITKYLQWDTSALNAAETGTNAKSLCHSLEAAAYSRLKLLEHAESMQKLLLKSIHIENSSATETDAFNSFKFDLYLVTVIHSALNVTPDLVLLNELGDGNSFKQL